MNHHPAGGDAQGGADLRSKKRQVFSPDARARSGDGFIYFEPYGGLANRLRVIASFAALARKVPHPIGFHWINGEGQVGCSFEHLFQPVADVVQVERWLAVERVKDLRSRNPLRRWSSRRYNRGVGVNLLVRDWDAPGVRVERQLPRLQFLHPAARALVHTCHSFGNYKPHLKDFRLVEPLQQRLDSFAQRHGFGAPTVGVHVRRTDNDLARRHSPLEAFEAAMQRELDVRSDTWFFLCTDEPDVVELLQARFPGRVLALEKDLSRDTEAGMEAALIDMLLLARSRRVLGSYWSSFSQIASEIGGIELEVVTALKPGS